MFDLIALSGRESQANDQENHKHFSEHHCKFSKAPIFAVFLSTTSIKANRIAEASSLPPQKNTRGFSTTSEWLSAKNFHA
jgi:hypothetical protein